MSQRKRSYSPKLKVQEARYGVRMNYVLFPIDFRELRAILAKNGYELTVIQGRIPPPPTRISFSGEIARKAETTVQLDSDSGDIGVVGRSLNETVTAFEQLSEVIQTELGIDIHDNVRFFFTTVHYTLDTGRTPRHEITKVVQDNPYFSRFSGLLGESVSLFSVRLFPKDKIPNQEDWFDITIEPDILNADLYHIGIVFRNSDRDKRERFVKNLDEMVVKLIKIIEGEE